MGKETAGEDKVFSCRMISRIQDKAEVWKRGRWGGILRPLLPNLKGKAPP